MDCIVRCIAASSTDCFPRERMENTLDRRACCVVVSAMAIWGVGDHARLCCSLLRRRSGLGRRQEGEGRQRRRWAQRSAAASGLGCGGRHEV
jgi:hypothetical protein